MRLVDSWRAKREDAWLARWKAEHRWDALARYNAEVARGLVHTPEWREYMASEQERFDSEHGRTRHGEPSGFPIVLEGRR